MPRYSKTFLDHFNNPRNVGVIEGAEGVGTEKNEVCGDTMTLYLRMTDVTGLRRRVSRRWGAARR